MLCNTTFAELTAECVAVAFVSLLQIPLPLPRLPYAEAMAKYGSDKPDTRCALRNMYDEVRASQCASAVCLVESLLVFWCFLVLVGASAIAVDWLLSQCTWAQTLRFASN
jgi:hypothetical protein